MGRSISYLHQKKLFVFSDIEGNKVHFASKETGRITQSFSESGVFKIAVSPTEKFLAFSGNMTFIFDMDEKKVIRQSPQKFGGGSDIVLVEAGQSVAVLNFGSNEIEVIPFRSTSSKRSKRWNVPFLFSKIAGTADGKKVVAVSGSGLYVLDGMNGKANFSSVAHTNPIVSLSFDPERNDELTSIDQTLACYKHKITTNETHRIQNIPNRNVSAALPIVSKNRLVYSITGEGVFSWNITQQKEKRLGKNDFFPFEMAIDPKTGILIARDEMTIRFLDFPSGKVKCEYSSGDGSDINDMTLLQSKLYVLHSNGKLVQINLKKKFQVTVSTEKVDMATLLAISRNGRYLALGNCQNSGLAIVDTVTRKFRVLSGPADGKSHVLAFSPGSEFLVVAKKSRIELWNVATGTKVRDFDVNDVAVTAWTVSSDGRFIAVGDELGRIHVWRMPENKKGR